VGGTVGALLTGVFAERSINGVFDGAIAGNPGQVLIQGTAVLAAMLYSGGASFVLLKLIGLVIPLRAAASEEVEGLDISAHGEEAYMQIGGSSPVMHEKAPVATPGFSTARADA
jgi:Amt family ammonium transporter